MSAQTAVERTGVGASVARRPTIVRAGRVLLVSGAFGTLGQLLFFDVWLGINFPIAIGLLLGGGWAVRRKPRVALADGWLGPAAVCFATFAAVRSDPNLVALDVLTSLALAGAALASYGGRPVVSRSFGGLLGLAVSAVGWAATGAIPAISNAHLAPPPRHATARRIAPVVPVLRGLVIAVPILVAFGILFASADAVFAGIVEGLFRVDLQLGDVGWRLAFGVVLAWLAAGGLAFAATTAEPEPTHPTTTRLIGTTELVTVLASVNILFAVFVGLQAAYLFGGLDTLAATGLTYAEYARRGFFELVAVTALAGGLVVFAERFARHRSWMLLGAAVALALQAIVVLVSAALRLRLYQDAYGWTELRLYVLATIVVLGICLVALVTTVVVNRVQWVGHVLVIASLVVGLGLNLLGPVRFITEQNVARILEPSLVPAHGSAGLDRAYALGLGDDAVPELLRALPALDPGEGELLAADLSVRLDSLRADEALRSWQAWNLGRATARNALEDARSAGAIP